MRLAAAVVVLLLLLLAAPDSGCCHAGQFSAQVAAGWLYLRLACTAWTERTNAPIRTAKAKLLLGNESIKAAESEYVKKAMLDIRYQLLSGILVHAVERPSV